METAELGIETRDFPSCPEKLSTSFLLSCFPAVPCKSIRNISKVLTNPMEYRKWSSGEVTTVPIPLRSAALPGRWGLRLVLGLGFFQKMGVKHLGCSSLSVCLNTRIHLHESGLSHNLTRSLISGALWHAEDRTTTPDCTAHRCTWSCASWTMLQAHPAGSCGADRGVQDMSCRVCNQSPKKGEVHLCGHASLSSCMTEGFPVTAQQCPSLGAVHS